jgi:hydrogenase maturation protease
VDCVRGGGEPGAIYRFRPNDIDVKSNPVKISFNDYGIYDYIRLAEVLDVLPPTIIFGMEPMVIDWGTNLSPVLEAKIDKMKEFVLAEIDKYLHEMQI